jgi:hypothetical protein
MKSIHQANENLLHLLFDWKRKEAQSIRFAIKQVDGIWTISFYSVGTAEDDAHTFAMFTGETHDELKKWALDRLVDYHLKGTLKV